MTIVTNEAFLQACFGADWRDAHVTGFAEDPGELEGLGLKHYWGGRRWRSWPDTLGLAHENAYFVVSLFGDDPVTGQAKRRKALFRATHVVVIDDVGTKVPWDALVGKPSPSWSLETSPGNYQLGYILDRPETDAGRVNALLDEMVAHGLAPDGTDPGMKGVTRYVRLPQGRNTKAKYGPGGFRCDLAVWEPARRVGLGDLAAAWGIALPAPGTVSAVPGTLLGADVADDELYGLLAGWGMVTGERAADGVGFVCECPWIGDHTGRSDSGAAYWLGGAFRCHHGHCADRGRRDLGLWADGRVQSESGGLARLGAWSFDPVPGYVGPHGRTGAAGTAVRAPDVRDAAGTSGTGVAFGTGVASEFFGELIFVIPEDKFYSVRTGELLTRAAVDFAWGAKLSSAGVLPVVSPRTGETLAPSRWFADESNMHRARNADRITYWPGAGRFFEDGGLSLANKWAAPGRAGLSVTDADVDLWLRLVRHVVGCEGPDAVESVLDWMALVVGAPGVKPGWHVAIQGGQGLGKDMLIQPVMAGVGTDNVGTVNATSLHSSFNSWAERRLVIVNELKQSTKGTQTGADQYNALKELSENTQARIKINQKNTKEYYARNVSAFYVTSNDERALAMEADDRRFLVVMAGEVALWPAADYAALADWMKERGGAGLAAEWLHERWDAMPAARRAALSGKAPGTKGKSQMIHNTEDPVVTYMREQIEGGMWPDLMTGTDITNDLTNASRTGAGGFRFAPPPQRWAMLLKSLGGMKVNKGESVPLKSGGKAKMWATRGGDRFAFLGEGQLAQAYVSAAGHAFADPAGGADVIEMKPKPTGD